jgi:antitoxin component YwqK of YwqJK toxin-antitoxin module
MLIVSCSGEKQEILSTYQDGKPKRVHYLKTIEGKSVAVYEKMFYNNGKLRIEGALKNDAKTGKWTFYFENGQVFATADFTMDEAGRNWRVFSTDKKSLVTAEDTLITVALNPDNELVGISVRNGAKGKMFRFYPSWKVKETWSLVNNVLNGKAAAFFEDGKPQSIHYYADGKKDSVFAVYTENGTILYNGQYKDGVKTGKWEFFSADGAVQTKVYDQNGNLIEK